MLVEPLTITKGVRNPRNIAETLQALAPVAFALTGPRPAARIWGGVEHLREEIGSPMAPCDRSRYGHDVAAARAASADEAAFDRAWQEGRAMNLERLLQYSLEFDGDAH
jgi:hypothetical protein